MHSLREMEDLKEKQFILVPKSIRGVEWCLFSEAVLDHIDSYTTAQYGDKPNDQAEGWTPATCAEHCSRYGNRHGKNQREGQEMLDFKKIAHYSCLGYMKMKNNEFQDDLDPSDEVHEIVMSDTLNEEQKYIRIIELIERIK